MINGDFDRVAETLYKAAGFETTAQAPLLVLAERLLGDGAVRTVPAGVLRSEGAIARLGQAWRIYLAEDCSPHRRKFILAHELSHWALGPDAPEESCDRLAAALVLPKAAFSVGLRRARTASVRLARSFGVDQSCAWLRAGEVTGKGVAVVQPQLVRVRGSWERQPPRNDMRAAAALSAPRGMHKAVLRDDPSRVVLRESSGLFRAV